MSDINCNKYFNQLTEEIMTKANQTQDYTNLQERLQLFTNNYHSKCNSNISTNTYQTKQTQQTHLAEQTQLTE